MASIDDFAPPSTGLKAADLEGAEITLTIKSYEGKEFTEKSREGVEYQRMKPVFSFNETEKTMVMNKTNLESIAYAYGKEMDDWLGKPVTLYPTITDMNGKKVECIRIRAVKENTGTPKFLQSKAAQAPLATPSNLDDAIPF
jgi:hypothetical protein